MSISRAGLMLSLGLILSLGCSPRPIAAPPARGNTTNPSGVAGGETPADTNAAENRPAGENGFAAGEDADARTPAVRKFRFYYAGVINKLTPGKMARVWLPVATTNHEQRVEVAAVRLPVPHRDSTDVARKNRLIYFEAEVPESGELPFEVEYVVERFEILMRLAQNSESDKVASYLKPERMVPVDRSLTVRLLGGERPRGTPLQIARRVYDAVDDHMKYDKPAGQPWGRGDAVWACESGYGNCTDFHSLFISVSRDLEIPALFEIGFPLSPDAKSGEVAGYHCWAKFVSDGRWLPVDISEADKDPALKDYYFGNLTADRVTFTVGRDLELDPASAAGPVNFLVYPYVEVDGNPHADFEKRFRYEDVP
jgi:transglutaminase-like putative cysteine protease